jgi:hypothetical protein
MTKTRQQAHSLCLLHFKQKIVRQVRTYWYVASSAKFSARWWEQTVQQEGQKGTLTQFNDVQGYPFCAIDLTPTSFLASERDALGIVTENAIVAIATALEVYLTDMVRRTVFLRPDFLEKGDHKFTSGEIAATLVKGEPIERWLANVMAEKITRGKSDRDMIDGVMRLIKRSLDQTGELARDTWIRWSYVRNAIVHAGGLVTEDLARVWPGRFPASSVPLRLMSEDLMACQAEAQALVAAVDSHYLKSVVGPEDCKLLVRELFVRHGIEDRTLLAKITGAHLREKFGVGEVQKALEYQRKYNPKPDQEGIIFSEDILAQML